MKLQRITSDEARGENFRCLTVQQIADALQISAKSVRTRLRKRIIPSVTVADYGRGRFRRVVPEHVFRAWMEEQLAAPAPALVGAPAPVKLHQRHHSYGTPAQVRAVPRTIEEAFAL